MTDISLVNIIYYLYLFLRLGIVLYFLIFVNKSKYINGYSKRLPFVLWILFVLLCVFAVSGDYWTYMYWFEEGGRYDSHMEPIWNSIKKIIPWNYSLFRTLVWGVGLLLFARIIYYCNVDKALAYCLFGAFYINYFCYARAAVALSFLLFGFVLLYCGKEGISSNFWRWILFLLFAWIGLSMHKSMYIIIPALILPFWVKLNRSTLKILVLLFPLFSILFNIFFPYFSSVAFESELFGASASNYLSLGYNKASRFIKELSDRLPFIILYFIAILELYKQGGGNSVIRKVSASAFYVLYIAFLFATVISANGMTFFYRIINMAFPFMIITIAYTMQKVNQMKKISVFLLLIIVFDLVVQIRYFMFINHNVIFDQMRERYLDLLYIIN